MFVKLLVPILALMAILAVVSTMAAPEEISGDVTGTSVEIGSSAESRLMEKNIKENHKKIHRHIKDLGDRRRHDRLMRSFREQKHRFDFD